MKKYNKDNVVIKFNGYDSFDENFSQAEQDLFVLMCLNGKKNGTFLDLGCHEPIKINNTFLLESKFDWNGVSVDIDSNLIQKYQNIRKCKTYVQDATKITFDNILKHYQTNHIDYLSLDLEPAQITLEALKNIPFDKIEFSVITYEHDKYRFGDTYKNLSYEILKDNGYELICNDVLYGGNIFEDWYYNPKYIEFEFVKILKSNNKEASTIVYNK